MLLIRQAQIDSLGAGLRRRFEDQLVRHFCQLYVRECAEAGGQRQIALLVRRGMSRAKRRGYTGRKEVGLFIALMFILGDGFESDPQLPWLSRLLDHGSMPMELRPECAFDDALEYLEATAGQHAGYIVRAMLRLRSYELDSAPETTGEEWIDDCCDRLEVYYPEKFDYQGMVATRTMARLARERAATYGLHSNRSAMLYAILMFMMGSGFDEDLLYPWASKALAATGEEHERANLLHRAAMHHLENSLTPDSQWAQRT